MLEEGKFKSRFKDCIYSRNSPLTGLFWGVEQKHFLDCLSITVKTNNRAVKIHWYFRLIVRKCWFFFFFAIQMISFFSFCPHQGPAGWSTRRPRSGGSRAWTRSGSVTSCWATSRRCGRSSTAATPCSTCRTRSLPASTLCSTCWVRLTSL